MKNFMKKELFILFFLINFFFFNLALGQSISLSPASLEKKPNNTFSLTLNVSSVTNLFGVAFDLNFNPSLIDFLNATEGNFLNQGCQTSLMTAENPPGKLIFGYTRLGSSCGGVSGSGTLAILNFQTLNQTGTASLTFSNNKLCLLQNQDCNFVLGNWTGANINIILDNTPPSPPKNLVVR